MLLVSGYCVINLVFGLITTLRLHRLNMQSVEAWRNHAIISIHIQNIVLKIHLTTYDVFLLFLFENAHIIFILKYMYYRYNDTALLRNIKHFQREHFSTINYNGYIN